MISSAARYAVAALCHLAGQPAGAQTTCTDIALPLGLPQKFLAKTLTVLVQVGLVQALRGARGGFCLARPAPSITLLEVIEAVDGPVVGQVDPWTDGPAQQLDGRLRAVMDKAAAVCRDQLRRVRLSDLV